MSDLGPRTPNACRPRLSIWALSVLMGLIASASFALDLPSEARFVDESAYLSQSYYARLWWSGQLDHPAWLDYPSYDLPPLPKYLIGTTLQFGGYGLPGPEDAVRWYRDTSSRIGTAEALKAARWPSVVFGGLGCAAICGLGALAVDRRVGMLASLLLMLNPLYRLHSRRAMSDVIAESLILLAALASLHAWRRFIAGKKGLDAWLSSALSGFFAGLAPLAKLNGALAMLIVSGWVILAVVLPRVAAMRKWSVVGSAALSGLVSLATFVCLNPFLTARPRGSLPPELAKISRMSLPRRAAFLVEHRVSVSNQQKKLFPHNALKGWQSKPSTVAIQGFGRFGFFGPGHSDSTRRFDLTQDWGALLWLPWVSAGAFVLLGRGRSQFLAHEPPTAWAVLVQAAIALVVVSAYLPLAWDRYFLSLQAGSALLASGACVALLDIVRHTPKASDRES